MLKYYLTKFMFVLLLLVPFSCTKVANHPDCDLLPVTGPCKAYIPKYYFDKTDQKCKEFVWGGCQGVVPFETLAACNKKCPCQGD